MKYVIFYNSFYCSQDQEVTFAIFGAFLGAKIIVSNSSKEKQQFVSKQEYWIQCEGKFNSSTTTKILSAIFFQETAFIP